MAHYRAKLQTPLSVEDAFAYLSDFSTAAEWDPGVVSAKRRGRGQLKEGTEFDLVASFLGREVPITYRLLEYDPPRAVTLVGENATVVSRDRITFEGTSGGTMISYEAKLTLKGPLAIGDALLAIAFRRVGDRALDGLRDKLAWETPRVGQPEPAVSR